MTLAAPLDADPGAVPAASASGTKAEGLRALRAAALDPGSPATVIEGVARISSETLEWDPATGRFRVEVDFPETVSRRRLLNAEPSRGRAERMLDRLTASGRGAGLSGVLYDNRDRGHSSLSPTRYPRLTRTEYGEELRRLGLDRGLNELLRFDAVTLGNASLAFKGPRGRSLPRLATSTAQGAARLHQNYRSNQLYVFPEHRDHDPGRGDLFHAATPYVWISQGSSGSDRPLLGALADAVAALRPETRARLAAEGLVAPAVQMLVRRAALAEGVDYLSGAAHPSVLDPERVDRVRLIREAQALTADAIPPAPRLAVIDEPQPEPGRDLFGDGLSELLFDTPGAVARLARGASGRRRYLLTGAAEDPNGRPLTYHWRVLRGDPERISLQSLDPEDRVVELVVDWPRPRPVPGDPDLLSSRIDVGLFVHNGEVWSPPAFFSLYFPPGRAVAHDAEGRPVRIDYMTEDSDPVLFPRRSWRDAYRYADDGALLGWTRTHEDGETAFFTAHGHRVISWRDGRPHRVAEVAYPVTRRRDAHRVEPRETGLQLNYVYRGPDDEVGTPTPLPDAGAFSEAQ